MLEAFSLESIIDEFHFQALHSQQLILTSDLSMLSNASNLLHYREYKKKHCVVSVGNDPANFEYLDNLDTSIIRNGR